MTIDIEREAFEQKFPVPKGVYWNPNCEWYMPLDRGHNLADAYHGQWEAWQAARAQHGEAEPVAKVTSEMKARCIGEFSFSIPDVCYECVAEGPDKDCYLCDGEIEIERSVEVPWDTCKEIYKRMAKYAPPTATSGGVSMELVEAIHDLNPFDDKFGIDFQDEMISYTCNYCEFSADNEDDPEIIHDEHCPVSRLRQMLTAAPSPEQSNPIPSNKLREAAKLALDFCASGEIEKRPLTAVSHLRGMAMLLLSQLPEQGHAVVGCPCGGGDGLECPGPDGRPLCDDEQNFCPGCGKPCVELPFEDEEEADIANPPAEDE